MSGDRRQFSLPPVVVLLVAGLIAAVPGAPAQAITKAELDAACAESQEAYDIYQRARASFGEAAAALEVADLALSDAEYKEQRIRGLYQTRQTEQLELQERVESQVEMYICRR